MRLEIRCPYCDSYFVVYESKYDEQYKEVWSCTRCGRSFMVEYVWEAKVNAIRVEVRKL